MKTILIDPSVVPKLPVMRYTKTGNIKRIHENNLAKMYQRINMLPYNMFNQNLLVGLLQNLAIDSKWTKEYAIAYTKLRSRSLCSAFDLASPHNKGTVHPNTVFYNGCREFFCSLDKESDLTDLTNLNPLVPIYSTISTFTYQPTAERERHPQIDYSLDYAIMGINIVELAMGWWFYMQDAVNDESGIHQYIAKVVMPKFEMLHNELALFNSLYSHIVDKVGYSELMVGEKLDFNTVVIHDHLTTFVQFWVQQMKSVNWKSSSLLMLYLKTELTPNIEMIFDALQYDIKYNSNVIWCFELNVIKYFIIYFTLVDELSMTADSNKGRLEQLIPLIKSRFDNIKVPEFKSHALDMLNKLKILTA